MNDTKPTEQKHDFKDGAQKVSEGIKDLKESLKEHDFKSDARKVAEGAKNLADSLKKHDFKTELHEAFAEAKKDPSSLWKKPETPRPGKDLAVAGLVAAIAGFVLLLVTSGAFMGVVCVILGLVAMLAGILGLKTEGRTLALAGTGASLLAILLAIGQIRSATRKPDPTEELVRLLTAQLAQSSNTPGSEDAKALLERLKSAEARQDIQELSKVFGELQSLDVPLPDGAAGWMASARDTLKSHAFGALRGGSDGLTDVPGSSPSDAPRAFKKIPNAFGEESDGPTSGKKTDRFGREIRTQDDDPPAGPSGKRIDEVLPVLKKAKIETMVVNLPNKVRLLLSKLPDGSYMGTFEVTQDQWLAVMGGENPSAEDNVGDDHPVDSIWPADCLAFVEKLNKLTDVKNVGLHFRIPSEEEWETACLAGSRSDFGKRLDGVRVTERNFLEIAWCSDNKTWPRDLDPSRDAHIGISHSVGRKQPNAFGLYDMHGNVEELTFGRSQGGNRFSAKGGYWASNDDMMRADRSNGVEEPSPDMIGQKPEITLGFRVAASIMDKDIARILVAAEKVTANGGAAFFGFYPGMSEADATKLAGHYGLKIGEDPMESAIKQRGGYDGSTDIPAHCRFEVNPATKNTIQIRFNQSAIEELTKETTRGFDELCNALSKFFGELECISDGEEFGDAKIYQRKTSDGMAVSLERTPHINTIYLTLQNLVAVESQAVAQMTAANNARIQAVEPVLKEAGIKTKTIELPNGVQLLLTELPDGRYMGTFEVTQAQYVSLMVGENPSQCVGADFPVDSVSVRDCLDFIKKANELPAVKDEGLRFQLPSLADWKTACRAGTDGDYTRKLDGTDVTRDLLSEMMTPSEEEKTRHSPHPVGTAAPNAFGLYDMFGNVSEWMADKEVKEQLTNKGKIIETKQFLMGGNWNTNPDYVKPIRVDGTNDHHESADPEKASPSCGFRVSVISQERELKRAKEEAARAYALSNNGRIDAVKPVLEKAGIETKEIELPGGVKLLLNKLPDGAWAAAFETTQAQWKSLLHDNPSSFQGDPVCTDESILSIWRSWKDDNPEKYRGTGLPVDQMSPSDIRTFLVLLNALPAVREAGLTFHLPTQDEWLYIALAGAKGKFAKPLGGGDASVGQMGWHAENVEGAKNAPKRLQVVGQKQPNTFGLYDVHGNVAEFAETLHGGGHSRPGYYAMGGSVGPGKSSLKSVQENLALERPIGGLGETLDEYRGVKPPFTGFRVVATEGGLRHLVDPEMVAASNARIAAVKPALEGKGIETKVLDLPGGVKLLLNKLPGGFWVGAFEVTQAQFLSVLGENPSIVLDYREQKDVREHPWLYRTGDRPVDNVSKAGAEAFLRALGALPCAKEAGLAFRLPSYQEWSRFSGGRWTPDRRGKHVSFPGRKTLLDMAWVGREAGSTDRTGESKVVVRGSGLLDSSKETEVGLSQPVGRKSPNTYGLYDMFGNVWEWTSTPQQEPRKEQGEPYVPAPGSITDSRGAVIPDPHFFVAGASFITDYHAEKVQIHNGGIDTESSVRILGEAAPPSDSYVLQGAKEGDTVILYYADNTTQEYIKAESAGSMAGALHPAVGFRVWAVPAPAPVEKSAPAPMPPEAAQFVAASNARIDAVKPVLDEAGIETKTVELPGGVRILMNKLPNGAWMAAFETTQAQFVSLFGRNPSRKISKGGDRAVDNVSWNQATIYAAVLNQLPSVKESGLYFRLPSSTEWETACRGGGGIAPLGKPLEKGKGKLDDMGWYDKNSDIGGVPQTHRVGQLQPNAFGLYDMIGNVAEWTATAYSQRAPGDNTTGPRRIWRGGSWLSPKEKCSAAYRGLLSTDTTMPDTGFRLYATEDGSDIKDEAVTFRDKDYRDAIHKEPRPDDRTAEEKLLGAIIEYGKAMEKAEMQLQMEEIRFYLDLLDIEPAFLW